MMTIYQHFMAIEFHSDFNVFYNYVYIAIKWQPFHRLHPTMNHCPIIWTVITKFIDFKPFFKNVCSFFRLKKPPYISAWRTLYNLTGRTPPARAESCRHDNIISHLFHDFNDIMFFDAGQFSYACDINILPFFFQLSDCPLDFPSPELFPGFTVFTNCMQRCWHPQQLFTPDAKLARFLFCKSHSFASAST